MAVFKCKMCGGTIEFNPGDTVGVCDSCGTKQTLPRLDDDRRANLYDRANHFRRNNEFDKAMGIYETILNEDPTDAEAYWSLVLCKYGVEYVEDPATHRRVPTVNRAQYTSVLADEDYKAAVKNADAAQKALYEAEAKAIDEIQKGILEISQKEEPFDVFICYKETDAQGRRTVDSVRATELYHELTKEGFKVFFARITLEDKLGTAYEPYIFAALNSAKVMVVLGTKPEHFNAVWVKNEWSRYLALIRAGAQKTLIPAYQDMDPYDLPEEFSHLQAQDMSKLGFMQDLIRGVKKLTAVDEPKPAVKETVVVSQPAASASAAPLLERAFMFLEDGKWAEADEYCEKVLDLEPKNARAYLGKLMAQLQVRTEAGLKNAAEPFDGCDNAVKAARFDPALAEQLKADNAFIRKRNETARKESIYQSGLKIMNAAKTEQEFKAAAADFGMIKGVKDADTLAKTCLEKAEIARQEAIYQNGLRKMNAAKTEADYKEAARVFTEIKGFRDADDQVLVCLKSAKNVHNDEIYNEAVELMNSKEFIINGIVLYQNAIKKFESIIDWKDSRTKIDECNQKIEAIRTAEEEQKRKAEEERLAAEKRRKLIKKVAMIGSPLLAVLIVFIIVLNAVIIPNGKYKKALALADSGKYKDAIEAFEALGDYKDTKVRIHEQHYQIAAAAEKRGDNRTAMLEYGKAGSYKDAAEKARGCQKSVSGLIAAGYNHTVGLKAGGTVVATGENDYGQCGVDGWTNIVAVAAGDYHTIGLKADGTVVATGWNDDGQCSVSFWTDIAAVAAGIFHTVGLKADGTVVASEFIESESTKYYGLRYYGQCDVDGWTDIVAVSAGYYHTVELKADGTVVATGYNDDGRCSVGGWTDIVAVAAGGYHTVGLRADGTVVATGENDKGQCNVSGWKDIVAVVAGGYQTVGLKSDGTVVATGENDKGQCNVIGWKDIVAVAAGDYHTVGLKADGTVVATGENDYGQCDVDGWTNMKLPKDNLK